MYHLVDRREVKTHRYKFFGHKGLEKTHKKGHWQEHVQLIVLQIKGQETFFPLICHFLRLFLLGLGSSGGDAEVHTLAKASQDQKDEVERQNTSESIGSLAECKQH